MASPFKVFRRYQKVLLAVLAVMAMIAFGVGDSLQKIGQRIGGTGDSAAEVETSVGNLTAIEIRNLIGSRHTANMFMYRATIAAIPEYEQFAQFIPSVAQHFGSDQPREVVFGWLMQHEADRLGVTVDNEQVDAYIRQQTQRKLTPAAFTKVIRELRISAPELYDIIRGELRAHTAYRLTSPVAALAPEQYWKHYQQLNTRQKIEVAGLPVREFASRIEPPGESQLSRFFESHKSRFESSADGEYRPGFRQPPKVRLQYLQVSYLDVSSQVQKSSPVTDKDIENYYEAKKGIDRRLQEIDTAPSGTDDAAPLDPDFEAEPGDASGPSLGKESPEADAPESSEERPEPPATPDPDTPDDAADSPGETQPEESSCGPAQDSKADDDTSLISTDEDERKARPVEDASTVEEDAATESEPSTAAEEADEAGEAAAGKAANGEADDLEFPAAKPKKPAPAPRREVKFKPLDDELRNLIRESLMHERTLARMKEIAAVASRELSDVSFEMARKNEFDLTKLKPEDAPRLAERARQEMETVGQRHGLKFAETGLLNARELSEVPGLGKSVEPDAAEISETSVRNVIELSFSGELLCRAFLTESTAAGSGESRDRFVIWKVQDVPAHVPTLDEPGVREQVIEAWKLQQALPLAEKRAAELAALAGSGAGLATGLAGQTVTGEPDSAAVTVRQTPEFSWFRQSSAAASDMRAPEVQLSSIVGVTAAGMKFMEYVFDTLQEGEVGSVLNDDASIAYVVKVLTRRPADREAFKDAALFSPASPYGRLARLDLQQTQAAWVKELERKYAVKWRESEGASEENDE